VKSSRGLKSFFRSFRYLRRYWGRLGVSIVCVVLIALLWGGGMGMFAPILKVLIDPEGLHGWAWRSMTEDRIEADLIRREITVESLPVSVVLDVVQVEEGSLAAQAGIERGDWILGLYEGPDKTFMRGDALARRLANTPAGQRVALIRYAPATRTFGRAELVLGQARTDSRVLGYFARGLAEPETREQRFPLMVWILGVVVIMTLTRNVLRFIQGFLVQSTIWRANMNMRCDMYNTALHLPMTFYSREGTTDTMSRFLHDTHELAQGQIAFFGKTLAEPAKALASFILALCFSWELTLWALVLGPVAAILIHTISQITKRATKRALVGFAHLLGILEETLTGIKVVKAYTMESTERRGFFAAARTLFKEFRRIAMLDAATAPSIETLGVAVGAVGAAVGGYRVLHGQMDAPTFFTWLALMVAAFDPVRKLAKVYTRFQKADAAAERIFEVRDRACEGRTPGAPDLPRHTESVEFRSVTFRYPGAAEDAVSDLSLRVQAGQTLAIVGPNGCGKTTLVSLVPRLLVPDSGQVLIDGTDISTCSVRSLRRQIGYVTQDAVLFDSTIAENISYGKRGASRDEVLAAAGKAFVHEFVDEMPEGFETVVGQRGAMLSGGQKQRITIARAILRDPAVLIFDEATSQVDADSEKRIHQALEEFMKGRTTLLIAHRFSTIVSADRIAVMDQGRIVDIGTHEQLVGRCDLYKQLYQTQFAAGEA